MEVLPPSLLTRVYLAAFVVLVTCIAILSMTIAHNTFIAAQEMKQIKLILNDLYPYEGEE